MKIYSSVIPAYTVDSVFSPIRNKTDYMKILITAMRLLLINVGEVSKTEPILRIVIDKMSRLFFYDRSKYFSVSFPFVIEEEGGVIRTFTTYSGKEINNKALSELSYILNSNQYIHSQSLLDFYIEPYDISFDSIYLLEEMLLIEPAYMRYDFDPKNEEGKLHPLHHLDLHYSQYGTLKIGLFDSIKEDLFEDIHNTKTDCIFLNHNM